MKKSSRQFISGFIKATGAGFISGLILWLSGIDNFAPIWLPPGFALAYMHIKWVKKINSTKSDIKIKTAI
jgi:hypothetical protein